MDMTFRERLERLDPRLHQVFVGLVNDVTPVLTSIEHVLPEFTRHDPSHSVKLESIALDVLAPGVATHLSSIDIFALLCALWLHDAGMGEIPEIEQAEKARHAFKEKLISYQRLGRNQRECWQDYVRDRHPFFCPALAEKFLPGKEVPGNLIHWIGRIAQSHGERNLHNRQEWPNRVAVGDRLFLQPAALGVLLRLADILHFNHDRAPEYMFEHRRVSNAVSIAHWKAHQVAADYIIEHDLCRFDGSTKDDEAYWFALQFTEAMDEEVRYCKQVVLPTIDDPFRNLLSFSRIENRIEAIGFARRREAVTLRVDTSKILEDLLNDSLYAGKPAWFREVLQNAFDACRDRAALDLASQPSVRIEVQSDPEKIRLEDEGIGMLPETVEGFLFVAGASYWSSQQYRSSVDKPPGHVGRFGIGFMSLFAVAERIEITTRHLHSNEAWRYVIRGTKRAIRVEASDRPYPGTTIEVALKTGTLLANDILELFDSTCSFPEFPLEMVVDGVIERSFHERTTPSTSRGDIKLVPPIEGRTEARLLEVDLSLPGVKGDYYLPKIHVPHFGAFIPDMRQWLKTLGWNFGGQSQSQTYFGGINYPPLYSVSGESGFISLPSLGSLRIAVSPNEYPLEMNLARDQFISGEATRRLHRVLCEWLDSVLATDLEAELAAKQDPGIRAVIAARWSWTIFHAWHGTLPEPATVINGLNAIPKPFPPSPWPCLSALMKREIVFGCMDRDRRTSILPLRELVRRGSRVFACGLMQGQISEHVVRRVFEMDSEAYLLMVLPDLEFGILDLRYWASDEFLVPIPEHARCAYGLRLGAIQSVEPERPFPFFPRELDHLGFPVASGPTEYAILDYRGLMAEAKFNPYEGGPKITGFFNRRNAKVQELIQGLCRFSDRYELRRVAGREAKRLKLAMILGEHDQYESDTRRRLVEALNTLCQHLDLDIRFSPTDLPLYFDGSKARPFGRPGIESRALQAAGALEQLETHNFVLS